MHIITKLENLKGMSLHKVGLKTSHFPRLFIMKKTKKTFIHMPKYGCYLILDDIIRLSRDSDNRPYLLLINSSQKYYINDDYYNKIKELIRKNNNVIDL